MPNIAIRDDAGKVLNVIPADRYVIVVQKDDRITKSFSSADLIDQIGLVEFAKAQLLAEVAALSQPKGGDKQ